MQSNMFVFQYHSGSGRRVGNQIAMQQEGKSGRFEVLSRQAFEFLGAWGIMCTSSRTHFDT